MNNEDLENILEWMDRAISDLELFRTHLKEHLHGSFKQIKKDPEEEVIEIEGKRFYHYPRGR